MTYTEFTPIDGGQLWTNKQLAELLQTTEQSLRTAKSRNPEKLIEGCHWVRDESARILWTQEGRLTLSEILGIPTGNKLVPEGNGSVQTCHNPVTGIDALLQPHAQSLAHQAITSRLPVLVELEVKRILTTPTPDDRAFLAKLTDSFGFLGAIRHLQGLPGEVSRELALKGGDSNG